MKENIKLLKVMFEMTEKLKLFIEAAVKNDELLEKLKGLKNLSSKEWTEQIMALASEVGVTLTEDDFRQIYGAELTDDKLEKIAGGSVEDDMSLDERMALLISLTLQMEEERREALKP